jgi:hypothetical protein
VNQQNIGAIFYIATWQLKAGIVEQEETAIGKQQCGKHISATVNQPATIRELQVVVVFYV